MSFLTFQSELALITTQLQIVNSNIGHFYNINKQNLVEILFCNISNKEYRICNILKMKIVYSGGVSMSLSFSSISDDD